MQKNNNRIWLFIYKLHRYIGVSSAIVLIMLSITGIALNHTEDLKLDDKMIESSIILDWYGVKAPDNLNSFSTQKHWLTQVGQQVFFDRTPLIKSEEKLLGAIETEEFIVAGLSGSLLLLSPQGALIEQSSFKKIEQLGLDMRKNIIIRSSKGMVFSEDEMLSWNLYNNRNNHSITWSSPTVLPEVISQKIKHISRSSIIPLERVILDLHSGRFFGLIGVIIVDLSGLFLIVLSLSGCAIWLKNKLRKRWNNKKQRSD